MNLPSANQFSDLMCFIIISLLQILLFNIIYFVHTSTHSYEENIFLAWNHVLNIKFWKMLLALKR